MWAVGSFSLGGFEKQSELNSQHPDYVMFGISGTNNFRLPCYLFDSRILVFLTQLNLTSFLNRIQWSLRWHWIWNERNLGSQDCRIWPTLPRRKSLGTP
jgi:hypothetical protein